MHPVERAMYACAPPERAARDYYAPLAMRCLGRVRRAARRPFVLGLQGPQGCGKSTLAGALVTGLADAGVRGVAVSIDDFYLTRQEQVALASRHPGNPYLLHRGYPGTHDVALGVQVLDRLLALSSGEEMVVPVYDKSAHGGRGDRAPVDRWRLVRGALDVVVLEGWMVGFTPIAEPWLDPEMRAVDGYLTAYEAWWAKLMALVALDVADVATIVDWRVDAERARRRAGAPALCDADVRAYIEAFLPAYRIYVPRVRAYPPCADVLHVSLGADRLPVTPLALS
jgi:D-glycerate 3-kinase